MTTDAPKEDKALTKARAQLSDAQAVVSDAQAALERMRRKRRRTREKLDRANERLERSKARTRRWKDKARSAETQVEVLRDLNRQLTVGYRESRASDAAALHFAAEAINAFAADAAALRAVHRDTEHTDYVDHLTFRLRQNLIEARQFLDQQGEGARAADLADLLNALPPDSTHR